MKSYQCFIQLLNEISRLPDTAENSSIDEAAKNLSDYFGRERLFELKCFCEFDFLIDFLIEMFSVEWMIGKLFDDGWTKEEIWKLGFDKADIEKVEMGF